MFFNQSGIWTLISPLCNIKIAVGNIAVSMKLIVQLNKGLREFLSNIHSDSRMEGTEFGVQHSRSPWPYICHKVCSISHEWSIQGSSEGNFIKSGTKHEIGLNDELIRFLMIWGQGYSDLAKYYFGHNSRNPTLNMTQITQMSFDEVMMIDGTLYPQHSGSGVVVL